MKCIDIGTIQAYMDGEIDIGVKKDIDKHLNQCDKCNGLYSELKSTDDFVFEKMDYYKNNIPSKNIALNKSKQTKSNNKEGVFEFMSKYKKFAVVACTVLVLSSTLVFQPVRAAISDFLMIFRAEDVKGINFSLEDIQKIQNSLQGKEPEIDLEKMGKIQMQGGETKNASLSDLKNLEYNAYVPQNLSEKDLNIIISTPSTLNFTLNADNANALLKSFGAKNPLPKGIDGKTFSVKFSSVINMNYSDRASGKNFSIMELKTPEIYAPSDVNIDELYNSIIDLPILPDDIKRQLLAIKDWKSTLVVPVVDNVTEVDINGSKGYIYSEDYNYNGNKSSHSSAIWLRDGIICSISGNIDRNETIDLAKSLR